MCVVLRLCSVWCVSCLAHAIEVVLDEVLGGQAEGGEGEHVGDVECGAARRQVEVGHRVRQAVVRQRHRLPGTRHVTTIFFILIIFLFGK